MAAGGLFGLGFGNGRMESVFAADSDMVFAAFCEVWGLLAGVLPIVALGLLVIYGVKRSGKTEDFSAIAGCGAATVLAVQGVLNVLGSVDVLPMTGVTLPFVSNGGTAMVAAWGLMALIKKMEREQGENGWRNGLRHFS
jgi:cell division protein FtsW (lipid II flippase)